MGAHLKYMCDRIFSINLLLHDTILIHPNCRKDIQNALVHGL